MSRIFRPVRSILATGAARHVPNNRPVVIQRVKMGRAGNIKRTVTFLVASYFLFSVYQTVVFGPLFKALDDFVDEAGPEDEDGEELEPIFIPLPFTTRQVDPLPYSGTDPEWQEFIKASKDAEFQKKVRANLAGIVLSVAGSSAMLTARFGKDLKVRRWWMDIDYPYRPPPEFERIGILIDEDIEIAKRKVDSNVVTLTQRILSPTPLLWSTMAFTKTMLKQNAADVARMFGWEGKEAPGIFNGPSTPASSGPPQPPSQASTVQKTLQRIREESTRRPEEVKNPAEMVTRKTPAGEPQSEKTTAPAGSGPASGPGKSLDSPSQASTRQSDRPTAHDLVRGVTGNGPWDAFKGTWAKTFKPVRSQPPRGSFLVSGLVELETPRATVVIDVAAWYNPQAKKYDAKSMYMGVRRVQLKTQSPLR